jgi:hypothetical protein
MSRQSEFARLRAAGWIVTVDSPWRRALVALRAVATSSVRAVSRPVRRPAGGVAAAGGTAGGTA